MFATGFGVMNENDRIEKLQSSAHAALLHLRPGFPGGRRCLDPGESLPTALTDAEKARVGDGCYDLLLILSQAVKPAEGLRILDRAVQLRPKTTAAYHLRRADCLERTGNLAGRDRENQQAAGSIL